MFIILFVLMSCMFSIYYFIQQTEFNGSVEYSGKVRHFRAIPQENWFEYALIMDYFDIDNPPTGYILNHDKSKYLFHNSSHINYMLNRNDKDKDKDHKTLCSSVKLLTNLNYFGVCFNPISVYFCYDKNESLLYIISEVSNIPWFEKTYYLSYIDNSDGRITNNMLSKKMHVSPFNPIKRQKYSFDYRKTNDTIFFKVTVYEKTRMIINAQMMLYKNNIERRKFRGFRSINTMLNIHKEAFYIWIKGLPLYDWVKKIE